MEFQDPKAGEPPLAELSRIQFGILSNSEILKASVFEDSHTIEKAKDLYDNRLGVYNLMGNDNLCGTCGARRASDCDGHFGHVKLPLAIYHPLHIRYLRNLLNRICLVCHRFKGPKEVKKGTFEEEATWMEIKRQIEDQAKDRESSDDQETGFSLTTSSLTFQLMHASAKLGSMPESLKHVRSSTNYKCAARLEDELDASESSDDEEGCKYCGVKLKRDERYPNLVVTLSKMKDSSYETLEMKAVGREERIPVDYWSFVQGHDGECRNIRPLFPFEALSILKSLSKKVIRKLGMDEHLARPESLIMNALPLPPSGSRIVETDFGSSLPRTSTDGQHMHLRRLASEIKHFRSSATGKLNFEGYSDLVMRLQNVASDYLKGSKWEHGVKPKTYNAVADNVEKEDKLMRGHILAKTNNASARMVVVGDPSIRLEELMVPLFLVEHLTIPEKVTALNINRLQQIVDNGPRANILRTGALFVIRPGGDRVRLSRNFGRMTLEVGDTVHRHLRNGDLVIVNRPPSLSKHSIMAMRVRLHRGCSLSINPLICASFQADFDGDCMHLFVPQSFEALAEVQGLMSVSDQLINPQGGQSNNALAEDSRLGAYLITSSCLFLDKTEMCRLMSTSLASLPIPAILKSPKLNGPLWTGQQLYSTALPQGSCYRLADKKCSTNVLKGTFIRDGELLVCDGDSKWLGNAPDALTSVISKLQGPAAALLYLNRAQDLANMYLGDHGFSVGLPDFQLTSDRSQLLKRRLEEVARANRDALMRTLLANEHVQREELKKNPTSKRGLSLEMDCHRSKGLYLGTSGNRVQALDNVAIGRFQSKFGQIATRLAKDYCKKVNPLLVMIKAGSKGSMSKLNQQAISLGLQLYKGEYLIPWSIQDLFGQKDVTEVSSLKAVDLLQFEKRLPQVNLPGYWESRGIITSSYLDGLSSPKFFMHNIASRYGLMRAKVEQPNLLLKRLLLFLRDLHVGYDGSVRSLEGQQIIQYAYGGLLEMEEKGVSPEKNFRSWFEAGEAVGVVAATAITEPLYQLKLDAPNMIGAKAMGPLELINETLSSSKILKPMDRRVLLRMPSSLRNRRHGQEKGATRIQQHLKPVTLDMVALTILIEYRKTQTEVEEGGRKSPWVGHIRLRGCRQKNFSLFGSQYISVIARGSENFEISVEDLSQRFQERLEAHQVLVEEILKSLKIKYSKCTFSSSNRCQFGLSSASREEQKSCIHFFMDVPSWVATLDDNEHEVEHEVFSSGLLEAMKTTILPTLLRTTIKGDERIESLNILWEEANWNPRCAKSTSSRNSYKNGIGELVVEVTVKEMYCKVRGKAWEVMQVACLPIIQLLDWQRCMPYSIQEIHHVLGLEAAKAVMLQRLELAVEGMGKAVNLEHLELIVDSILTSGEVNGASMKGYMDLCRTLSRSTPFSNAAFQNPKNSFILAGRQGACETIDGALSSSVWGKATSLGTGSNARVFWQPAKAVDEPLSVIKEGVDIHQCIAQLNSLLPPEPKRSVPIRNTLIKSKRETIAEALIHRPHRLVELSPRDDRRRCTDERSPQHLSRHVENSSKVLSVGTKGILGDGRNIRLTRQKTAEANRTLGDGRHFKSSQMITAGNGRSIEHSQRIKRSHRDSPRSTRQLERAAKVAEDAHATKARVEGIPGEGMSSICMDQGSGDEVNRRVEQRRERQKLRRTKSASDDGNTSEQENHAPDPAQSPDSVGSPGADGHGDSSSFHTPKESLDHADSANSSPCTKLRKGLDPPPLSLDIQASEVDQMSSIGQPPLPTSNSKLMRDDSSSMKESSNKVDPLESSPDVVGSGSESPTAERSRDQRSRHLVTKTERRYAFEDRAEDALERHKEEQKDEWERLLRLSRTIKYILHKKYIAGDRLHYEDQKYIVEKLLRFHPDNALKIGCGVHYIKVDHHENHSKSRCFFVVRLDGTVCDFSFHKCIKGYANAKSPALAMQYDHEVLLKHERENCSDRDMPYSYPDLDLPYSPPPNVHELPAIDPISPTDGSKLIVSKHEEQSWCESSELNQRTLAVQESSIASGAR